MGLRLIVWLGALAGTVAVAGVMTVAVQVDDWSRDLTTNVAETRWTASDPDLQPVVTRLSSAAAADLIDSVGRALPRWTLVGRRETDSTIVLDFVRTTRLFRFRDDVTVRVTDRGDRTEVTARSASRVGTGDLGQNPRNLRELTRALRARLR